MPDTRFKMPSEPKNGLDLLRWLIFEPVLLKRFSEKLTEEERQRWVLKAYPWIVLFSCLVWMISILGIVMFDIPSRIPQVYEADFIEQWQQDPDIILRIYFMAKEAVFGLGGMLVGVLVSGLGGVLVGGLDGGLITWLGFGLTFMPAFFINYFRLIFYPAYVLRSLFPVTFEHNPYRKDGIIWLSIWPANRKLLRLAKQQPEIAIDFVNFLLEYRPLQEKLAIRILHVATAGNWAQQALALNADVLSPPAIPGKKRKFQPSERWITILEQLRQQLITSQTQTQIGFKKDAFEQFFELLKAFRVQTLRESSKWNHYYLEAIDKWIEVATEKLKTFKQQAETLEPITTNIYRSGEALRPETDEPIFVGRDDLKETLSFEILTARSMPMFLIQGQRRVGKTSLLNFLPELLGPRFKIVYQDLQGLAERSLGGWLKALKRTVDRTLKGSRSLPDSGSLWNPPEDWLLAWSGFREYLEKISEKQDYKLILAFDEYEILHDDIFQKDPEKARQLLGTMRSFSQHQNQVVFLFVGARFFSELQEPNWNEYFVQVKHLHVDYLKREDTLKLVQRPVPDFNLIYPDDVANRIFDLTQGHPALIQQTCSEMVNLANRSNRKNMGHDDLDSVLDKHILHRENVTIQIFWTQFCTEKDRETVTQILAGQPSTDKVSLYRLEQHGYILKEGNSWKIRVPLFETWLRKFVETFE